MNPRTVKKLKCELEASLQFCAQLHNLIRSVIFDVDSRQSPYLPPYLVIEGDQPSIPAPTVSSIPPVPKQPVPVAAAPPPVAAAPAPDNSTMPWAVRGRGQPPQVASKTNPPKAQPPSQSTASPGNPEGSTLRKLRKKKLPPNTEPPVNLPEFDNAGRRLVPKKDHNIRLFEVLRFRALRQGDFVAARTTSRDLWILARVMKDYPGIDSVSPLEFIQLSESRRDALFREKVHVKDVEDKDGDNFFQVTRNLILPLPRTYSEAADWGSRIKKGMRVSFYVESVSTKYRPCSRGCASFHRYIQCIRIQLHCIRQLFLIALPIAAMTTILSSWSSTGKSQTRRGSFQNITSQRALYL